MRNWAALALLREANYRRLFLGQTISLVGDGVTPVAIAFAVLGLTGSATDLGIVLAARSITITALLLAGGVLADRISPRLAMLYADYARTIVMAAMGALLVTGAATIWQLAVLYAVEGAASGIFNPASSAIVPAVVPRAHWQEGNALLNLSKSGGRVAGPALAGLILAVSSPGWAIAADAATFAASAAFLLALDTPARAAAGRAPSFLAELREGWTEFSSRSWLWSLVIGASIANAVFWPAFYVLGPTVADAELGGSGAWALIAASFGVGSLVGGIVSLRLKLRRPLFVSEGLLALYLPVALLAGPAPLVAIVLGSFASGMTIAFAEVIWETVAAQQIPADALARVSAYDWFGSLALEPLGLALIGPLGAGIGIGTTLWIVAGITLACQLAIVSVPGVRRIESRPGAPAIETRPLRPVDPAG